MARLDPAIHGLQHRAPTRHWVVAWTRSRSTFMPDLSALLAERGGFALSRERAIFTNNPLDLWKVRVDRLEAMAMLVEAVDVGSLSAASRKMNVSLPTVSRKIADLELHLGARLLTRSTRKLTLTDAGAAYVSCREADP